VERELRQDLNQYATHEQVQREETHLVNTSLQALPQILQYIQKDMGIQELWCSNFWVAGITNKPQ
jgi:hypothetical protein